MTKRKPSLHKIKVIKTRDKYQGERSPYGEWARENGGPEHLEANPDLVPAKEAAPSTPQLIMGEAIDHLQGRQREVYILTMREDKSLFEAGEILGISKDTARTYKDRAIKFIQSYCKEAIKGGRV